MSKIRIYSIDFMRIIAIILVVAHHCWVWDGRDYIIPLTRIAIPFFFMTTGYFLYHKDSNVISDRVNASVKKMILLWIVGTLLYCVSEFWLGSLKGNLAKFVPSVYTPFLLVFFCHQKIGFQLWFLVAMVEALLAMKWISAKNKDRWFAGYRKWIVPSVLIIIGVCLNRLFINHHPLFGDKNILFPPVLFMSWPFVYLGYNVRKYRDELIAKLESKQLLLFAFSFFFIVLSYIEDKFQPNCGDNYFVTLPIVVSLFLLLLLRPTLGGEKLAYIGQKYVLWVYIFHIMVYTWIQYNLGTYRHWALHPVVILAICFAIAPLAEWISEKTIFKLIAKKK